MNFPTARSTRINGLRIGDKLERDKNIRINEDQEICRLAAEKLAVETLLVELLSRFDDHDPNLTATIKDALDQATRFFGRSNFRRC